MTTTPSDDRPDWAAEPEHEYVERTDDHLDEPDPATTPSGNTVRADRSDAEAAHRADRPPTPSEESAADTQELDPQVAESYKEAIERGASVEGEGRI
jgi:hypothetical protein